MICKYILLKMFLNETKLICIQLNDSKYYYVSLTI